MKRKKIFQSERGMKRSEKQKIRIHSLIPSCKLLLLHLICKARSTRLSQPKNLYKILTKNQSPARFKTSRPENTAQEVLKTQRQKSLRLRNRKQYATKLVHLKSNERNASLFVIMRWWWRCGVDYDDDVEWKSRFESHWFLPKRDGNKGKREL